MPNSSILNLVWLALHRAPRHPRTYGFYPRPRSAAIDEPSGPRAPVSRLRSQRGLGHRPAKGGGRCAAVEDEPVAGQLHAHAFPERGKVDWVRRLAHPPMKVRENRNAGGPVSFVESAGEIPAHGDVTTVPEDRAQRVVERAVILGAFSNLQIAEQATERSAPLRSAPRVRAVKPPIAEP